MVHWGQMNVQKKNHFLFNINIILIIYPLLLFIYNIL